MLMLREAEIGDVAAEIFSVCALNAETFRLLPPNCFPEQKAHLFISNKIQILSKMIF